MSFFNFRHERAENWWDRASFAGTLWRLAAVDSHWTPPFYPDYRRAIDPKRNPHIARMDPRFLLTTGVRRSTRPSAKADVYEIDQTLTGDFKFDRPVAASILLFPPHSPNKTALLALLRCMNDPESLERHLDRVAEQLLEAGYSRLVVPSGISPYLNSGLLLDRWNLLPPLHTPNNPPYIPELISEFLQPGELSRLYHLDIPTDPPPGTVKTGRTVQADLHGPQQDPGNGSKSGFQIVPGEPARLAGDLLPLFLETMPARIGLPKPDRIEAEFILRWIGRWPLFTWLAITGEKTAGFILLQPDLAPRLKKARGGRCEKAGFYLEASSRTGRVAGLAAPCFTGQCSSHGTGVGKAYRSVRCQQALPRRNSSKNPARNRCKPTASSNGIWGPEW